jgi:hypothetical protein
VSDDSPQLSRVAFYLAKVSLNSEPFGVRVQLTGYTAHMRKPLDHGEVGKWGRAWRLEEIQVVLGHASRTTTERYARLAPDSIRRVANEAIEQWSDDSKAALGLVNDWSTPNSPYTQVPETMEPPIRVELETYGLRNRCSSEGVPPASRIRANSRSGAFNPSSFHLSE